MTRRLAAAAALTATAYALARFLTRGECCRACDMETP